MLAQLLKEICKIDGFKWIRTLYSYPRRITDELIDTIASEDKLVKYLDIPIQHCNAEVLKRMNRKGDKESLTALVKKLREKFRELSSEQPLLQAFRERRTSSLRSLRSL